MNAERLLKNIIKTKRVINEIEQQSINDPNIINDTMYIMLLNTAKFNFDNCKEKYSYYILSQRYNNQHVMIPTWTDKMNKHIDDIIKLEDDLKKFNEEMNELNTNHDMYEMLKNGLPIAIELKKEKIYSDIMSIA